jgi:hypothetical protein
MIRHSKNAAKVSPRGVRMSLTAGAAGAYLRVKAPNLALKRDTRPPRSSIW